MVRLLRPLKTGVHVLQTNRQGHRPTLCKGRNHIKQKACKVVALGDKDGRWSIWAKPSEFERAKLARLAGIEPATLGFGGQYSIH